ncbi:MAG: hypothetical protein M1819_000399 [Sarea resinae]|nr:MAG: hypothetical protein M1819_000399 [Sarea resinae]
MSSPSESTTVENIDAEKLRRGLRAMQLDQNHPFRNLYPSHFDSELFGCQNRDHAPAWHALPKILHDNYHGWPANKVGNRFLRTWCREFYKSYELYGHIGSGTFGCVFAGRSKPRNPGEPIKHYAIKIQGHDPGDFVRIGNQKALTMHQEACKLFCIKACDRVSKIHASFRHGPYTIIVMDQFSVDFNPAMNTEPTLLRLEDAPRHPGFSGINLTRKKRPMLDEIQCCKVASQMLEALLFLEDRSLTHQDLSQRNYLVDEDLNVQLIDFDSLEFVLSGRDQCYDHLPNNYEVEDRLTPEMCRGLYDRFEWKDDLRTIQVPLKAPFITVRHAQLWRFAVMVYQLLHGYVPWDSPDPDLWSYSDPLGHYNYNHWGSEDRKVRNARRERMLNEPLHVREDLSQDCADVLQAMLAIEPNDRPIINEIASFPWFQGSFLDRDHHFVRPAAPPSRVRRGPPPHSDDDDKPGNNPSAPLILSSDPSKAPSSRRGRSSSDSDSSDGDGGFGGDGGAAANDIDAEALQAQAQEAMGLLKRQEPVGFSELISRQRAERAEAAAAAAAAATGANMPRGGGGGPMARLLGLAEASAMVQNAQQNAGGADAQRFLEENMHLLERAPVGPAIIKKRRRAAGPDDDSESEAIGATRKRPRRS